MNEERLASFDTLAIVEPYLEEDTLVGKALQGSRRQWQASHHAIQSSTERTLTTRIPTATSMGTCTVTIFSAYDPRGNEISSVEHEQALDRKLKLIREMIEAAGSRAGQALPVPICSDLIRHYPLWGGYQVFKQQRAGEADLAISIAKKYRMRSLLAPGRMTWDQHQRGRWHNGRDPALTYEGTATDFF